MSNNAVRSSTTKDPAQPDSAADGSLADYVLGLADDALIYAQRLGEWVSRAPQIEEDMALGNIALDLLGQARSLLTYAGQLEGSGRDEDQLAYFRDEREFRCVHLVQLPRGDFADEMARLLWFAAYQFELYTRLTEVGDETLTGIASKAVKEVAYHRDHAQQWVIRLGDGTAVSHDRMQAALDRVAPFVPELFDDTSAAVAAAQVEKGVLPSSLAEPATAFVTSTLAEATLTWQPADRRSRGGREGVHDQAMGLLLAELQHIRRSHPEATRW